MYGTSLDVAAYTCGRLASGIVVFALALATRAFYVEDLLSATRGGRPKADFQTAITEVTQKYTLAYEGRAKEIFAGQGVLFTDEPPDCLLSILHPPGYPIFIAGVYSFAPPKLRSIARARRSCRFCMLLAWRLRHPTASFGHCLA